MMASVPVTFLIFINIATSLNNRSIQSNINAFMSNIHLAPEILSNTDRQDLGSDICTRRSCDQIITGRDLSYERALTIVQEEIYLTEADLEIIRKKRRKRYIVFRDRGNVNGFVSTMIASISIAVLAILSQKRGDNNQQEEGIRYCLNTANPLSHSNQFNNFFSNFQTPKFAYQEQVPRGKQIIVLPKEGLAPPSSPQPGTPKGGSRAVPDNSVNKEAIGLVPPGLHAIAVLPPYRRKIRRLGATCVIFSESDTSSIEVFKRSNVRNNSKRVHVHRTRQTQGLFKYASRGLKQVFRKLLGERLQRENQVAYRKKSNNCLPKKVIPRVYGFRCRVRLIRKRCTLGDTCDINGNECLQSKLTDRHQNCPITKKALGNPASFAPSYDLKTSSNIDHYRSVKIERRQTGQEFMSDSPPECRIEFTGCSQTL